MAVFFMIFLTKIMKQHFSATDRRFCIGSRFLQQLSADILFCYRFVLHKLLQFSEVFTGIEGDTYTLASITSGSTRFLIIAFQALGYIIMNNKTDIRFIDTHSEGDSSNNDINTLHQKIILGLRTGSRIKTGMIRSRFDFIGFQYLCQFLYFLTGETIDNTTLSFVLTNKHDDLTIDILVLRAHLIIQVRAVKRTLEFFGIHDA